MPIQAPSWTDFLFCPICCNEFAVNQRLPISLGCGHTICRQCLSTLHNRQCPFDQTSITTDVDNLPINNALLQLVSTNTSTNNNNNAGNASDNRNSNGGNEGASGSDGEANTTTRHTPPSVRQLSPEDLKCYNLANKCIESLALYLKSLVTNNGNFGSPLSRPMQRKLVSLVNTQLMEREGRERVLRAARSLGERTVTELILQHQNPLQLSSNLWAAVRSRGCQFLGPAMQEEVLKLVLKALEDGTAYSRKVLVMYVVQRLEPRFPQASKTSIGHVVQLLYRASCFKVSKREADSSLMQLKEEFRTYDALRREHDAQIVQIATEAGLRIAPDQWSSLLYGDTVHKSHMQSIIDKLQTPSSFAQSVQELVIALQRTGDPANLSGLRIHLKHLAGIDPSLESPPSSWQDVAKALESVHEVVVGLVEFVQHHGNRKLQECTTGQPSTNTKYKISLCRDLTVRRNCPRGSSCTFAHSEEELEKYRAKNRKNTKPGISVPHSGVGPLTAGSSNSANNGKNDFSTHTHPHNHGHNHHNPHAMVMLHPGNDNSAPASTATSPLRFDGLQSMHNKLPRSSYGDASSSLQTHGPPGAPHHMRSLHHSPIPPNSAQAVSAPPTAHRYDASTFGSTLNYPISTTGVPPRMPQGLSNINSSPIAMRTSSGAMISSRSFPNTLQPPTTHTHHPPLPPNITTTNPPIYHNNKNVTTSLSSPLSANKGIYNALPSEFYNTPIMGTNTRSSSLFSNNQPTAAGVGGNSGGINGKNNVDLKGNIVLTDKLRLAQIGMWDQQHHQHIVNASTAGEILSGASGIGGSPAHQSTSMYPSSDTVSIFGKKVNNVNMNLNKTLNGLAIGDQYMFKNDYAASLTGGMTNSKDSLICNDLPPQRSFWNAHNSNMMSGGNFADSTQERNTIAHNMSLNASPGPFRDRDSFVRSDSILDDDAATFEVPATSAGMGSKFGPICPMYKGHSSTATDVSHTNTYLDSWSSGDIRNQSTNKEHPLLERNTSGDINYSVFPNDTENSLALQIRQQLQRSANGQQQLQQRILQNQQQQQQTQRPSAFDNFNSMQNTLLTDLTFNHSGLERDRTCAGEDRANFDLGYNALQNMLASADGNANMDMNKGSSMWSGGLKSADATFWNDSLTNAAAKTKELQLQRQQQQQQYQQLLNKGRNSEEGSIDSSRMRDIEQELSEIVDKSWSNADDSGIKLQ
ncbi:roquin-2 [Zeugodacus cucurbitae]|uniref:RING-type E3 ubiquitin transferase n=1 Tax=Zeugodacus cucurbitae TaxID=28588 RepID=A0A0A1XT28_ZEUCU|nr:roquin-2 [Zeugodacus cucurbitae]XP_054085332.1 roquin-2 [Zeugodacus cucurbitae]